MIMEMEPTTTWDVVCMEIEIEPDTGGMWHLEGVYGRRVADAASIRDGRRYTVREMPQFTRRIAECHRLNLERRRELGRPQERGMDIKANRRTLPSKADIQHAEREPTSENGAETEHKPATSCIAESDPEPVEH
jgi:hypothetical protein